MVNWAKAKRIFERIISKNGVFIQYLERSTSGSESYNVDDPQTFGYGDEICYWRTGSFRVVVAPLKKEDLILDAGFYVEDYKRIYFDPDETPEAWEQIIYPSGSSFKYIIKSVDDWYLGDVTICKYADLRLLIPRSGSEY